MKATTGSLARRLIVASLVLVLVIVPLVGAGLSYSFRESASASFDERLSSMHRVLLAALERDPVSGELIVTDSLGDSRFGQVFSGWYWQISDGQGLSRGSRSLWDQRLPTDGRAGTHWRNIEGPRGQPLRLVERTLTLSHHPHPVVISLAVSRQELDTEVARFEWLLWLSLLALGTLLLAGLAAQIRWGLAPLRSLYADLAAVKAGQRERLDTQLPTELAELAATMNDVLDHDRRLIERGRATAGNLAHALKTPVSVLMTRVEKLPAAERDKMRQELERINAAVRHHLARASAAGSSALAAEVHVGQVLAPVLEGLTRLADRRGVRVSILLADELALRIDPNDLQELVGNLLENAIDWAASRVTLSIQRESRALCLCLDDDGPGMSEDERAAVLRRGVRLDEQRPGNGLGLAIVEELVELYGGELALEAAPLGGLRVTVKLPAGASSAQR
ncbi:GHKL domain-containing protein [Halomonas sp. DP8Y7-3]|uniref:sensor histidine kinase n=1 Tax=unclassified Halomonas TaxID=2609666 RepID=UPI001C96ACB5|nr:MULTISPECIES: ATP-binding protein [unclassified Halomonas]MBY5929402.1 GHKL domain-containing protein [Halomonas sp. DP8Y7-3]MBY5983802.1 GHKL domain-containing protein [Halomonas sp. DP5Y7-2]